MQNLWIFSQKISFLAENSFSDDQIYDCCHKNFDLASTGRTSGTAQALLLLHGIFKKPDHWWPAHSDTKSSSRPYWWSDPCSTKSSSSHTDGQPWAAQSCLANHTGGQPTVTWNRLADHIGGQPPMAPSHLADHTGDQPSGGIQHFVICRGANSKKCIMAIRKKYLGSHPKSLQILNLLIESFHLI